MLPTDEEKKKIIDIFPGLRFEQGDGGFFLRGNLNFAAKYNTNSEAYDFFGLKDHRADIHGEFLIEVELSKGNPYRAISEVGGKGGESAMEKIADNMGVPLSQLHAWKKDRGAISVCVWGYSQEKKNIGIVEFVCEVVAPYFCDVVFYGNNGYWLRGEYRHYLPGLFESYNEAIIKMTIGEVEEKSITENCLHDFTSVLKNNKNFELFKKMILEDGKIHRRRREKFWDEEHRDVCYQERVVRFMGESAYEGLCKFKDNLIRFGLKSQLT